MADIINLKIPESIIGAGAVAKLGELALKFNPARVLVVTDPTITKIGIIEKVQAILEKAGLQFSIYTGCAPEPTIKSITYLAQIVRDGKHDMLVGIGGGSVMDAVKVASQLILNECYSANDLLAGTAVTQAITKILIPTTAGTGSEWSNIAVIYDDCEDKPENTTKIFASPCNYADAAIIDPELTLTMPQAVTTDTGMDALTHAIEAYTSRKANVLSDMLAGTAIKMIAENLPAAFNQGTSNLLARVNMSIAASLAMSAVVLSGVGMAHMANVPLGQKAKLSHGAACALMLPQVMKFNLPANPSKFAQIATFMGKNIDHLDMLEAAEKSVEAVKELAMAVGMKLSLADSKINDSDIESMVISIHSRKGPPVNSSNPRDVTPADTKSMITRAIHGLE